MAAPWSELGAGLREQVVARRAVQLARLEATAVVLQGEMQSAHRWINRTGAAKAGLFARAEQAGPLLTLTVGSRGPGETDGGVFHGAWLEAAHFDGQRSPRGHRITPTLPLTRATVTPPNPYAVIRPTVDRLLTEIRAAIEAPG